MACTLPLLALLATLSAAPVRAASLVVAFSGTLDRVDEQLGSLGGAITLGTPFSGTLTLDLEAVDTDPFPEHGNYLDAVVAMTVSVGAFTFTLSEVGQAVTSSDVDDFHAQSFVDAAGPFVLFPNLGDFGFSLYDPSATALSSDLLADVSTWTLGSSAASS